MPAVVMALVGWFISALRQYLPGIVGRVLLALGIGFVVKTVALPSLLALVASRVDAFTPTMRAYFGAFGIDMAVTIILSACAARAGQKMLLRRMSGS